MLKYKEGGGGIQRACTGRILWFAADVLFYRTSYVTDMKPRFYMRTTQHTQTHMLLWLINWSNNANLATANNTVWNTPAEECGKIDTRFR